MLTYVSIICLLYFYLGTFTILQVTLWRRCNPLAVFLNDFGSPSLIVLIRIVVIKVLIIIVFPPN